MLNRSPEWLLLSLDRQIANKLLEKDDNTPLTELQQRHLEEIKLRKHTTHANNYE